MGTFLFKLQYHRANLQAILRRNSAEDSVSNSLVSSFLYLATQVHLKGCWSLSKSRTKSAVNPSTLTYITLVPAIFA